MPHHIGALFRGELLGYLTTKEFKGVCHGVALTWLAACMIHDEKKYIQRIKNIVKQGDSLLETISLLREKVKQHQKLTDIELDLFEILSFYENLLLCHNPATHHDLFNGPLNQSSIEPISQLVLSDPLQAMGGLTTVNTQIGIYTKKTIAKYLNSIAESIDSVNYEPGNHTIIGLIFGSDIHSIGLNYDTQFRKWSFMDINQWPPKVLNRAHTRHIARLIFNGFAKYTDEGEPKYPYIAFNTQIISTGHDDKQDQLAQLLQELSNRHLKINSKVAEISGEIGLTHLAARHGRADLITELAQDGANFNLEDWDGHTPACAAVLNNHMNVITALADIDTALLKTPNKDGDTPIYAAAQHGFIEILVELMRHGATLDTKNNIGRTPIHAAAQENQVNVITFVSGIDASLLNVQDNNGDTPLHVAADQGSGELVSRLLDSGVKLDIKNYKGVTALHFAAHLGHAHVIKTLAEKSPPLVDIPDDEGQTAVHDAAQEGHVNVIKVFAEYGINLDIADQAGRTPIYMATLNGQVEVIRELAKHHVLLDAKYKHGLSLAHVAALNGRLEVLIELSQLGVPLDTPTDDGVTPLFLAAQYGHVNIVQYLMNHNARQTSPYVTNATSLLAFANKQSNDVQYRIRALINLVGNETTRIFITPEQSAYMMGHDKVIKALRSPNDQAFMQLLDRVMAKQADLLRRGHIKDAEMIDNLHLELSGALLNYYAGEANQENYAIFKKSCQTAIEKARLTFQHHHGKEFVAKLAMAIVSLGVVNVALAAMSKYKTGNYSFRLFKKPLEVIEKGVRGMEPHIEMMS